MNRPIKKDVNYLQNLVDYAKRNLKKGYNSDSLRWALINQGHSRIEVDKALSMAQSETSRENLSASKVKPETAPQIQIMPSLEPEEKVPFWKRWFG